MAGFYLTLPRIIPPSTQHTACCKLTSYYWDLGDPWDYSWNWDLSSGSVYFSNLITSHTKCFFKLLSLPVYRKVVQSIHSGSICTPFSTLPGDVCMCSIIQKEKKNPALLAVIYYLCVLQLISMAMRFILIFNHMSTIFIE